MAFHISKFVEWKAGASSAPKYGISFELDCAMTDQTPEEATFSLKGTVVVANHPNDSRNSWAASDFAVLTLGGFDPINYNFTRGERYYMAPLPTLPNAPTEYVDAMRLEFRGDTYLTDGPNRVSLWSANGGLVLDNDSSDTTHTITINQTFKLKLTGDPKQEVLIYSTSGANSATDYTWLEHQTWASLFDFDYRPSAVHNGSTLLSCNRASGARGIYNGSALVELRTEGGPDATGNPPYIYGSGLKNQRKIGQE